MAKCAPCTAGCSTSGSAPNPKQKPGHDHAHRDRHPGPGPAAKPDHDLPLEITAVTLTINDADMTSDQSSHTARQMPGATRGWKVSWLPGQIFDRNTAMILADIARTGDIRPGHRLWPSPRAGPPKSA